MALFTLVTTTNFFQIRLGMDGRYNRMQQDAVISMNLSRSV